MPRNSDHTGQVINDIIHNALTSKENHIRIIYISEKNTWIARQIIHSAHLHKWFILGEPVPLQTWFASGELYNRLSNTYHTPVPYKFEMAKEEELS